MSEKIVVAFGGNAILKSNERGTAEEQRVNVRQACLAAAALVKAGNQVVITHGNGPQVGAVLLQNELAADTVPVMPLDVCGAATQGQIGYMIQQALGNILRESGVSTPVASVVTQVLVGVDDPAFANPTKPIGSYYPVDQARSIMTEKGWKMVEDKARGGFRRVVPSPMPLQIVEKDAIGALLEA
ncbi:MAG TPA: carbamate kinase, partial [Bacillota bacterium]|nr:carbamate kinase [Bacillota bacterium]